MKLNKDLNTKIEEFPKNLAYLAKLLLSEIESGKKSNTQIEEMIRLEIRELVLEGIGE
jgi:hypothetical protein